MIKPAKKICIIGPESTGKSTLSRQISIHYATRWVPELARYYVEHLDRPYHQSDILKICKGQLYSEKLIEPFANRFLFCDTNLIVTKIWMEIKYGTCDPWILKNMNAHAYQFYLLMDVDLPWEYDPQREYPHDREYLFGLYKANLEELGINHYKIISGVGRERLKKAITQIDMWCGN